MGKRPTDDFTQLLKDTAKLIDQPWDSEAVRHVAVMRLVRTNLENRALAGERIDPGDILKINEALKSFLPQSDLKVTLNIVEGRRLDLEPPPDPPEPPKPPPAPPPTETKPSSPPSAANVVPIRRDPGSIHDQPGVPLKHLQNEPWRQFVGPVGDP